MTEENGVLYFKMKWLRGCYRAYLRGDQGINWAISVSRALDAKQRIAILAEFKEEFGDTDLYKELDSALRLYKMMEDEVASSSSIDH